MPEVKDEIDACASAIVPGFMIERVVKDDALILHKLLSLVTNAHTSTLDIEQGQVDTQFLPGRTIVRDDVRARCHS